MCRRWIERCRRYAPLSWLIRQHLSPLTPPILGFGKDFMYLNLCDRGYQSHETNDQPQKGAQHGICLHNQPMDSHASKSYDHGLLIFLNIFLGSFNYIITIFNIIHVGIIHYKFCVFFVCTINFNSFRYHPMDTKRQQMSLCTLVPTIASARQTTQENYKHWKDIHSLKAYDNKKNMPPTACS